MNVSTMGKPERCLPSVVERTRDASAACRCLNVDEIRESSNGPNRPTEGKEGSGNRGHLTGEILNSPSYCRSRHAMVNICQLVEDVNMDHVIWRGSLIEDLSCIQVALNLSLFGMAGVDYMHPS
jgi:hypothetical protein